MMSNLFMRQFIAAIFLGICSISSATAACTATYSTRNDWSTGFVVDVVISNSGTVPISNWSVNWTYSNPIALVGAPWSSDFHLKGNAVSAVDNGSNPTIAPGASVSFGASVTFSGTAKPTPGALSVTATGCGGFYVNPQSSAALWVKSNSRDSRAAAINSSIAQIPTALWLTGATSTISNAVANYVDAANALNQSPVLVAYNIPDRDCGGASAGGASSSAAYETWIQEFARAIGTHQAIVILEPDALADAWAPMQCFSNKTSQTQTTRLNLLTYAISQFNSYAPNTRVYLDIGNSAWLPVADAANLLIAAGIAHAHGFSLNVSNFQTDAQSIAFGNAVNAALEKQHVSTKPFVIDTSRNGNGPLLAANGSTVWCDPTTRKVGLVPEQYPAGNIPDMRLWVKSPGGTDGCATPSGSTVPYAAVTFVPQIAYDLISGD